MSDVGPKRSFPWTTQTFSSSHQVGWSRDWGWDFFINVYGAVEGVGCIETFWKHLYKEFIYIGDCWLKGVKTKESKNVPIGFTSWCILISCFWISCPQSAKWNDIRRMRSYRLCHFFTNQVGIPKCQATEWGCWGKVETSDFPAWAALPGRWQCPGDCIVTGGNSCWPFAAF